MNLVSILLILIIAFFVIFMTADIGKIIDRLSSAVADAFNATNTSTVQSVLPIFNNKTNGSSYAKG